VETLNTPDWHGNRFREVKQEITLSPFRREQKYLALFFLFHLLDFTHHLLLFHRHLLTLEHWPVTRGWPFDEQDT